MTSTLLAVTSEDDMIDAYRPRIMFESSRVEQTDNPGEFPTVYRAGRGSRLPDPAVGAEPASGRDRIGWSTGFIGIRLRRAPFTGKIWTAPAVTGNPIQGNVGRNTHANQLQAGVRQQLTQYSGTLTANATSFVGSVHDPEG